MELIDNDYWWKSLVLDCPPGADDLTARVRVRQPQGYVQELTVDEVEVRDGKARVPILYPLVDDGRYDPKPGRLLLPLHEENALAIPLPDRRRRLGVVHHQDALVVGAGEAGVSPSPWRRTASGTSLVTDRGLLIFREYGLSLETAPGKENQS